MIVNTHNLLPNVWEFLCNSDIEFHNTSPSIYVDMLSHRNFPNSLFDALFGIGYESYRELFCVSNSTDETLSLVAKLSKMGFQPHKQHSFIDSSISNRYTHIYRHDYQGITVAIVREYPMNSFEAGCGVFIPTIDAWELMRGRVLNLIEAMAEEAQRRQEYKSSIQMYVSNWFGVISRTEFIHARATIYNKLHTDKKVVESLAKSPPRTRKKAEKSI